MMDKAQKLDHDDWRPVASLGLEVRPERGLPDTGELKTLLGEDIWRAIGPRAMRALVAPSRDMIERPSKHFRARLVYHGFALLKGRPSPGEEKKLERAAWAIELLHAGSLIVDDIQDQSPVRRGRPSLHRVYGPAEALCAGNWLYFRPMTLLSELRLSAAQENRMFRLYHQALERAHVGQALDLATKIDAVPKAEIPAICKAISTLKTGSLTSLAIGLGAVIADAEETDLLHLEDFGTRFGTALQQCDDVGCLTSSHLDPAKRFEDLLQKKASGVWALLQEVAPEWLPSFALAVDQLEESAEPLETWLRESSFAPKAFARILKDLSAAFADLSVLNHIDAAAARELRATGEHLIHAYR